MCIYLWCFLFAVIKRFFICLQLCFIFLLKNIYGIIHNLQNHIYIENFVFTFINCIRSANDGNLFSIHFTALWSDLALLKNGCFNSFFAGGLFVGSLMRQVAIILLNDYETRKEMNQQLHLINLLEKYFEIIRL